MRPDEIIKRGRVERKIPDAMTESWKTSMLNDQGNRRNQQVCLRVNREQRGRAMRKNGVLKIK